MTGFKTGAEPVEAERWRDLEESERLGGGDDVRRGRAQLEEPERARKSDFRPKEKMSSVEMRGSLVEWREGELGTELEERVREEREALRELGRDADWERGEQSVRRRKENGRRSLKFDFWEFLDGVLGDRRIVGVERTLEAVESGETEGEREREPSGRSAEAGTGCMADFVSGCGTSDMVS